MGKTMIATALSTTESVQAAFRVAKLAMGATMIVMELPTTEWA
jgi:hypothetical protein